MKKPAKTLVADTKLLTEIAPYLSAYGHHLSAYTHYYTYYMAYFNLGAGKKAKDISEYGERVLRSFLFTKNLGYSERLLKQEYGYNISELPQPEAISYDLVRPELEALYPKALQSPDHRKTKVEIACERYVASWKEKAPKLAEAFEKTLDGKQKATAFIQFSPELTLAFVLAVSSRNEYKFSVWRYGANGKALGSGWLMTPTEATKAFPEIFSGNWDYYDN